MRVAFDRGRGQLGVRATSSIAGDSGHPSAVRLELVIAELAPSLHE
jgi:hypothetical protein